MYHKRDRSYKGLKEGTGRVGVGVGRDTKDLFRVSS